MVLVALNAALAAVRVVSAETWVSCLSAWHARQATAMASTFSLVWSVRPSFANSVARGGAPHARPTACASGAQIR
eukprot:9494848-Pyramimonas_sp.AAC.1